jgi:heptaprenyl diphosphate synthase
VRIQSKAFERLCLGQIHETQGPQPGDDPLQHYLSVLADKTGSLIATAAQFGAMFGGASDEDIAAVTQFGEACGIAFQLADDVIDLTSIGDVSGKSPGTDLREHVPTMPMLLLSSLVEQGQADASTRELYAELQGDLSDDGHLAELVERLSVHEVVEETRLQARQWSKVASGHVESLTDDRVKSALITFAEMLVNRAA